MNIRKGPKGEYIYFKNSKSKKPLFYNLNNFRNETGEDYKICDIDILKSWIKETYNIF